MYGPYNSRGLNFFVHVFEGTCFLSPGITGSYEPIERLKERQGKGVAEAKAVETPSKRTKKTDKAKLVRQVIFKYLDRHRKMILHTPIAALIIR